MLGLNRDEFKTLKGFEYLYESYREWKEKFPQYKPQELLLLSGVFKMNFGKADIISRFTDVRLPRLAEYLEEQKIMPCDYKDYLDQCRTLEYNLHDTAICMPHNFEKMYTRLSQLIKNRQSEEEQRLFKTNYSTRKRMEFSSGDLLIRQPNSIGEIIEEGAALEHCVSGYANRHARGTLTIMFLREKSNPDKPFCTVEVSSRLKIVQCRECLNNNAYNPKPKAIEDFEKRYQEYLDSIVRNEAKKARSKKNDTGNKRKSRGNGRVHQGSEPQPQDNYGGAACTAVAV